MYIRRLLTFAFSVLFVATASAQESVFQVAENSGWVTSYDSSKNICFANPKTEDGLIFIGSLQGDISLVFSTPKLAWVKAGQDYEINFYTDRKRWSGTMRGVQYPPGLMLVGAVHPFLVALKAASKMSLEVEGVTLGPHSLSGSSQTLETMYSCIRAAKNGQFKAPEPVVLPWKGSVSWTAADYGKTFQGRGWTAVLKGQDNVDGTSTSYLQVTDEKKRPITLKLEGQSGELEATTLHYNQPALIFSAFNGGAHCCTVMTAVVEVNGYPAEVPIGEFDGGGGSFDDLDLDGSYELVTVDQRFLYTFGPYVVSNPPAQILAFNEGKFKDVTDSPQYRPYLRSRFLAQRADFESKDSSDGEAATIAGLLASASKLGLFSTLRNEFASKVLGKPADGFDTCYPPDCSPERRFKSLYEMIADRFGRWGYPVKNSLDEKSKAFFKELAAAPGFGVPGNESELSCEMGAYRFKANDDGLASFTGYEMGCDIEKAVTIESTSVASALCSGEGSFTFETYMFSKNSDGLRVARWQNDISEATENGEVFPACPAGSGGQ